MRLAVAQIPGAELVRWRDTLALLERQVADAAAQRAALVVLPECAFPAYYLESAATYRAAWRAGLPGPRDVIDAARGWAATHQVAICLGHIEEDGERLYNTATLIDPDGTVRGQAHKRFLWDFDHRWFTAGDELRPIETSLGRIGVMICADARLPEIPATLVKRGADLLIQPTAWVNTGTPAAPYNPQPDFMIPARAREFGVPIASASKHGPEGPTLFVGSSLICDAGGRVIVQAGRRDTNVLVAEVEPGAARTPELTEDERRRLAQPPRPPEDSPAPTRLPELTVLVADEAISATQLEVYDHMLAQLWDGRHEYAVLLLAPNEPAEAAGLHHAVVLGGPAEGLRYCGAIAIGSVSAADAARFAPIRCLALDGAHAVVVFGEGVTEQVLRTRALENRIYIIAYDRPPVRIYAPSGRRVQQVGVPLKMTETVDKCVAPQTDILHGRRPAQYDL